MAWRAVRVVDGAALEMLCTAMYLRFESVALRQLPEQAGVKACLF